ncbi:MAG TPA: tRNA uridine-5-carboxymethylaminomethyl(34) synthesis GTPase MnmE [Candidatus Latescibacteria bacterium]|jgi:tRNA modification GTPase|nr:tRNA uridine-5-carboxymethylaminomethyl(34) synthesis GTPase MnmE [Gemmatimonadaceae bacterium]MDP6014868.1 tRNA uridine-5-carboxymethylaminomethyl(34) synthesis GTPase MnmE [Candidatus Latescibacterota bacterium]HJP33777.1 tRNA uridine-5-carboxymethylaminomethyl(34) synthesis GTPase MnmE [Candidatus Latescibacterota bacterium]
MGGPDTIIAVSTPRGSGGVGLVRLSGPRALAVAQQVFDGRPPLGRHPRQVTYGRVVDDDGRPVDTALAWYLAAPDTYTSEDIVELSTHGSNAVLDLVIERGICHGARLAEPGEFTRRAFLNGRLDLMQAEAVADLVHSQSVSGLRAAYGVLEGGLSVRVRRLREDLVDARARLESLLDFSEDVTSAELGDIDRLMARVEYEAASLVDSFRGARARLDGFTVVLAGRPNAGKSTLLNALLGEDRAIVTDVPGTTRDWLEGRVMWSGESVRLIDTAGLHDTGDATEQAAMESTRQQMARADLVANIVDGADDRDAEELNCDTGDPLPQIIVLTKADLPSRASTAPGVETETVQVSALTGRGLGELRKAILRHVSPQTPDQTGAAPLRERHRAALAATAEATRHARRLLAEDTPEIAADELLRAAAHVDDLLGESQDEAVLDRIFAEFCVGK